MNTKNKTRTTAMPGIRVQRRKLGLSQQQLSDQLGISRSAVAMWESGASAPSTLILPALAAALRCQISDLYAPETEVNEK